MANGLSGHLTRLLLFLLLLGCAKFVFFGSRSAYALHSVEKPREAAHQEHLSLGPQGELVVTLKPKPIRAADLLQLTATLTWHPGWTVCLPSLEQLPWFFHVIDHYVEDPRVLDNESLQTTWIVTMDVLKPGSHTFPELPWILVERNLAWQQRSQRPARVQTAWSAAVPIEVEGLECPEDSCTEKALEPQPFPPVTVGDTLAQPMIVGGFLVMTCLVGFLWWRSRRATAPSKLDSGQPAPEKALEERLREARDRLRSSILLDEEFFKGLEKAIRVYLEETRGRDVSKRTKAEAVLKERSTNEESMARLFTVLKEILGFCAWFRFGSWRIEGQKDHGIGYHSINPGNVPTGDLVRVLDEALEALNEATREVFHGSV